jgi:hypothetical protein
VAVFGASQADKFNRKTVLINGSLACCFGITGFTIFCGIFEANRNPVYGIVAWSFLEIFTLSYSFFISILGLYLVEILDYQSRAFGMSIATILLNVFSFSEQYFFNHLLHLIGFWFFGIYAVIDLCAAMVVQRFLPETRGLELEEIQECFLERDAVLASEIIRRNRSNGT